PRWARTSKARSPPRDLFSYRGEGGSRTHVGLAPKPDFESGAFGHSATSPGLLLRGECMPRVLAPGQGEGQARSSLSFSRPPSAWPFAFTFAQWCATLPSGPTITVDRMTPIVFLP